MSGKHPNNKKAKQLSPGEETMHKAALRGALILTHVLLAHALLAPAGAALAADRTANDSAQAPSFVAGTAPSMRRPDAPALSAVAKDARWYQSALSGVDSPYPTSLKFLDDQGNWYTPFTQPGMTGRYDLRRWHR